LEKLVRRCEERGRAGGKRESLRGEREKDYQ